MARGTIIRRCRECRASGQKDVTRCDHKEAVYHIRYKIGAKQFSKLIGSNKMVHREFHPTLVRAGLRKVRFHDLRHT